MDSLSTGNSGHRPEIRVFHLEDGTVLRIAENDAIFAKRLTKMFGFGPTGVKLLRQKGLRAKRFGVDFVITGRSLFDFIDRDAAGEEEDE